MRFETPLALLLLLFIPLFLEQSWRSAVLRYLKLCNFPTDDWSIRFSSRVDLNTLPRSLRLRLRTPVLSCCRIAAYFCLVLALARPQAGSYYAETVSSGRDIMLLLDVSGSMEALDFKTEGKRVTRLEALKQVVSTFIDARKGDRMGLVVFGTDVYTQCPLTLDHSVLKGFVNELQVGMAGDRTALGDAIAIGLKRTRTIDAESKVIVLVTDGLRTAGRMDPIEAAEVAHEMEVKIHTIGIGGKKPAPFKKKGSFGFGSFDYHDVPLDEATLKKIAAGTGGKYFNAQKSEHLRRIYQAIDLLEERKDKTLEFVEYNELFFLPVALGLILFLVGELLNATVFVTVP